MTHLEDVGLEDEGVVDRDLLDFGHLFKHKEGTKKTLTNYAKRTDKTNKPKQTKIVEQCNGRGSAL